MSLRATLAAWGFAGALIASGAFVACKQDVSSTSTAEPAATPIDAQVMAFLSAARAQHHAADLKEDAGDLPGAIAALDRLVAMKRPHPDRIVVEIEEVLADTHARMAELRLRAGDLEAAAKDIAGGLEHAQDPTYFRGHLLEVSGLVEKTRYKALADAGRADDAERARQRAIKLLEESTSVNHQFILRTLPDAGDAGEKR